MSSIEPNSDNGQPSLGRKDQPPRKRESFDLLDPDSETYQCVSQEASLYIGLIEQCDEEGRQPSERDYKRLAPELGVLFNTIRKQKGLSPKQVVHFNTVRNRFKRFVKEGYDGLLDHSPGPEAGSKLTKKQRRVIEGMCFKRRFDEQIIDDVIYYVLRHADFDEIYDEVIKANRGVVNVSRSTVERAVRRFVKANGPAITLAHEGDKAFEKKHQPHTTNRVPGPNYRWIWDMRPLAFLVNNDGIICRVIASAIEDAFSGYPINCSFIPRKEEFTPKVEETVDFIGLTARRQLADAMDEHEIRSMELYTDHGAVFGKELKRHLEVLTRGSTPYKMVHSRPGLPQGRGMIEKFLHLLDKILKKIPGYIEVDTFERVKEVAKGPLLTFEQFVERMDIEIEKLRKKPPRKGEKQSREQLWKSDLQYTLPAPSQQRLIIFANTVKQHDAKVYRRGVYRKKTYFVPVTRTLETETLLSKLEGQHVPLRLAMRKEQLVAYVCLDGQDWVPFEPREMSQDDLDEFMELRNAAKRDIKKANRIAVDGLDAIMKETHTGDSLDDFLSGSTPEKTPTGGDGEEVQPTPSAPSLGDDNSGEAEKTAAEEPKSEDAAELAATLKRLKQRFQKGSK